VLAPDGHVGLAFAEVDGRRVAAQLVTRFGDTVVNRLSVWSGEAGDSKPNEAIQWAAIGDAKSRGYQKYDLEGIGFEAATAVRAGDKLPSGTSGSTTSFKLGFGGAVTVFPSSITYVPGRLASAAYRTAVRSTRGRKLMKRLRKAVRVGAWTQRQASRA
jgi:lipid II:glycine glycyltransferase (peptidoglycan interpeptide bridge formation enzyme)